ncbi:MAG: exodeoxyribonuclease VII large subunit [Sandaracinaceae bacterium]
MAKENPRVLTVRQLNGFARKKLEAWGTVWVEGELSDVNRGATGHFHFTLCDPRAEARIRCIMFRNEVSQSRARLQNGELVRLRATFSLYEPRGAFQLVASLALPVGEGDRRERVERLKKKLHAEGLLAPERKRPLPKYPRAIGVVTSRQGAALHDVIRVARGRAPVRIVVAHCQVQGADAPRSIVRALRAIGRVPGLEVVILTRGGGASADLTAFDDETVARAVADCPLPVVSGVGHEVDASVVDLVADVRAATPSNAAEMVVPDRQALSRELASRTRQLEQAFDAAMHRRRLAFERLGGRIADPSRALERVAHRLHAARASLERSVEARIARGRHLHGQLQHRLHRQDPRAALGRDRARFEGLVTRLRRALPPSLEARRRRLAELDARARRTLGPTLADHRASLGVIAGRLSALSPLEVLQRGYAIALHGPSGRALLDAADVSPGDLLTVRLASGSLEATVSAAHPRPTEEDGS